ncbi:MAG: SusF/SusE family outer membrane protein [Candidatus Azobacteroides sp.]|nr:SusF/SusE family outer membrane protein [Candidatus Azobacteroides sp.]
MLLVLPVSIQAEDGKEFLPEWQEGYLDIHQIATGRGNAAFMILPDGTTLIVDVGDLGDRESATIVPPLPDNNKLPGEWVATYIKHFYDHLGKNDRIDYIMLTHLHNDHIGGPWSKSIRPVDRDYHLTGVSQLVEYLTPAKIIDRGYPNYDYPTRAIVMGSSNVYLENYLKFVEYQENNRNTTFELFDVGSNTQMKLLYEPEKYPEFEIRNVYSNGTIWTGYGNETEHMFPAPGEMDKDNENILSNAILVTYGKFDFFTGGDITGTGSGWRNIEKPVAKVVGAVEVAVANHHAYSDSETNAIVQAFRPKAFIIPAWDNYHPQPEAVKRMIDDNLYPEERYVFTTGQADANKTRLAGQGLGDAIEPYGHVVTRVYPGGDTYQIFTLDAHSYDYPIIAKTEIFDAEFGNLYVRAAFDGQEETNYIMQRSNQDEYVSTKVALKKGEHAFKITSHRSFDRDFWGNASGRDGIAQVIDKDGENITFTIEEDGNYLFKFNIKTLAYAVEVQTTFDSEQEEMYIRGTFNDWAAGEMFLIADNQWQSDFVPLETGDYTMKFANTDDWSGLDWGVGNGLSGTVTQLAGSAGNLNFTITKGGRYVFFLNDKSWEYSIVHEDDITSSVTESLANSISVYPNPTTGIIHVKGADTKNKGIYDASGNQLLLTNRNTLDISFFEKGVYFLRTAGQTFKVIKN